MFPRYGRKNRKYKVKLSSGKVSFEQKIKWQSLISVVLLVVVIGISFLKFIPKGTVKTYLYHTYSTTEWNRALAPAAKSVVAFSGKVVSAYFSVFSVDDNKKTGTPSVKAKDLKEKKKPQPDKEEIKNEEEPKLPDEKWILPHQGDVSSPYGERIHPITGLSSFHRGIDIAAAWGDDVKAVHSGNVEKTGYDDSNGNYVILSHGNEITSVYIHLSEVSVNQGDFVSAEGIVGKVGSTGLATGPHIHFEIKEKGESVDPNKYISPK